jgi:hypothetical protein
MEMNLEETQVSRTQFLRKLGTLAAIGIGTVAVLPHRAGATAQSTNFICCINNSRCADNCGGSAHNYLCHNAQCGSGSDFCTGCVSGHGTDCWTQVLPGC